MKATTYIVIDGEEVELDQVSDDQLKDLGLESLIEQKIRVNERMSCSKTH